MADHNHIVSVDPNTVDERTIKWLHHSYSSKPVDMVSPRTSAIEQVLHNKQIQTMEASHQLVPWELLNSWDFNVFNYTHNEMCEILEFVFVQLNLLDEFNISKTTMRRFLQEISCRYLDNPYHNFKHGADVCHTVFRLVMMPQLNLILTHLEFFAELVGGLAHDVGHIGLNNDFLVKSEHPLALQHNDRSPLENMHCIILYEVFKMADCNILASLSKQQYKDLRNMLLTIILGTDMAHHLECIKRTEVNSK